MHKNDQENPTVPQPEGDDALFQALSQSKKQRRHKRIRTAAIIAGVLVVALVLGVTTLRRRVREQFALSDGEVLSAQVQRGTISTLVSGSGMLENVDSEVVSAPAGVEVTEILVQFGDTVAEGDLLATVDMAGLRSAMSSLQDTLNDLDDDISAAEGDRVSSSITAGVSGRVKILYAQEEDRVTDVMVENGALAVLSLDGYMAVDVETDALAEGDTVVVELSDGTQEDGVVESVVGGTATVLITDNGPLYGDCVTVMTEDGSKVGEGSLYIHSPLAVTGYAGTVSRVNVKENQSVSASSSLFTLTDTSTSANYDALLQTRRETEEDLLELLEIQNRGGLPSPISGSVYSVADLDETETGGEEAVELITLAPDAQMSVTISVDEGDILSLAVGQEADITVSSISDDVLPGTVTEIDKTASDGTYTAVITLDKAEGMLPGMTASVDVRIEGVDDALLIPVEALHQTSTGYYVYTSYDEETQEYGGQVDVVPGLTNSTYAEIKSGLEEGDTVYYSESVSFFGSFGGGRNFQNGSGQMPADFAESGMSSGQRPDAIGGEAMPQRPAGEMPGGRE